MTNKKSTNTIKFFESEDERKLLIRELSDEFTRNSIPLTKSQIPYDAKYCLSPVTQFLWTKHIQGDGTAMGLIIKEQEYGKKIFCEEYVGRPETLENRLSKEMFSKENREWKTYYDNWHKDVYDTIRIDEAAPGADENIDTTYKDAILSNMKEFEFIKVGRGYTSNYLNIEVSIKVDKGTWRPDTHIEFEIPALSKKFLIGNLFCFENTTTPKTGKNVSDSINSVFQNVKTVYASFIKKLISLQTGAVNPYKTLEHLPE